MLKRFICLCLRNKIRVSFNAIECIICDGAEKSTLISIFSLSAHYWYFVRWLRIQYRTNYSLSVIISFHDLIVFRSGRSFQFSISPLNFDSLFFSWFIEKFSHHRDHFWHFTTFYIVFHCIPSESHGKNQSIGYLLPGINFVNGIWRDRNQQNRKCFPFQLSVYSYEKKVISRAPTDFHCWRFCLKLMVPPSKQWAQHRHHSKPTNNLAFRLLNNNFEKKFIWFGCWQIGCEQISSPIDRVLIKSFFALSLQSKLLSMCFFSITITFDRFVCVVFLRIICEFRIIWNNNLIYGRRYHSSEFTWDLLL